MSVVPPFYQFINCGFFCTLAIENHCVLFKSHLVYKYKGQKYTYHSETFEVKSQHNFILPSVFEASRRTQISRHDGTGIRYNPVRSYPIHRND